MKIAIHHREGSFSEGWIQYCNKNGIDYKIVNAYANDIIKQIDDCDIFLWHHSNYDYRDALFAKQLLYSIKNKGLKVFPDFYTNWHFDDKVAQKYLLESINAPLVPSYVFYTKKEAMAWVRSIKLPIVFKLRGGSGSSNVKLVKTKKEAFNLINQAFGSGFSQFDRWNHLKFRLSNYKAGTESISAIPKGLIRSVIGSSYSDMCSKEKGYIYFQKFIPNNNYDTRVVVINGEVIAAERRFVREGDFRASGSGQYSYEDINLSILEIALSVAKRLSLQSVAFDFILDEDQKPLIVEISYGFGIGGISGVPGYWDKNLNWYNDKFRPEYWIIENLIQEAT